MSAYFKKIVVTGAGGQLAQALAAHSAVDKHEMIFLSKQDFDITDEQAVTETLAQIKPDLIINTAAYTNVDQAEDEVRAALIVNSDGVKNIAKAASGAPIIQLSTDYVFSGEKGQPYVETDQVGPINAYGLSKLNGELALQELTDQFVILRVSGIFSQYGRNFFNTMRRLFAEKNELNIVSDQMSCPTYAGHIADCIYKMLSSDLNFGVYHCCSDEGVSWFDFANEIASELDADVVLKPILASEYNAKAKRPANSVLNCNKLQNDYQLKLPDWRQALRELCK